MPERDPTARARDFEEVNLGFDVAGVQREAQRCLECAKPRCVVGCPVGVRIPEIVSLVLEGEFLRAAALLREDNVLPAITGRVCPQENQCEGACVLAKRFEPLAIGHIERFLADFELQSGQVGLPARAAATGRRVAIVGSGPAGLSCAGDLVQRGHEVVVFEALHEIGGVLVYGIPEFRLPKGIVRREVQNLRKMGVGFETNVVVGKTVTIDELMGAEGFDAVFVATGAGLPRFMGVPGENLAGVYSGNEFLARVNLMKAYDHEHYDSPVPGCRGKRVAVIGGGNTAMDAVRVALRLGAASATIVYRRSREEMPARAEELHHAEDEGARFLDLHAPLEFTGDDEGRLRGMRVRRMSLGEPDESGRRRPVPVEGSESFLPVEMAVVAVGTGANRLVQSSARDIGTDSRGYILADPETGETTRSGVFAGGDIVSGSATVILAMGAGRKVARAIDTYLQGLASRDN